MSLRVLAARLLALAAGAAHAQSPGMSLAQAAARRLPQPVLAETLLGRQVLQPLAAKMTIGS